MDKLGFNNKIILLRKSLKSIFNQTKLNLARKIKSLQKNDKQKQSANRKESELEAFKRLKPQEIPLCDAVHPEALRKTLTNPNSTEKDRAVARVLLNPMLQKTIQQLKEKHGPEIVENFLKENEKNIKNNKQKQQSKNPKKEKKQNEKQKKVIASDSEVDQHSEEQQESDDEDIEEENSDEVSNSNQESGDDQAVNESEQDSSNEEDILPVTTFKQPTNKATSPELPANPKPSKRKRSKEEIVKKSSDSFFVDSSGQNYLAAVADGASSASEEEDSPAPLRKIPQKAKLLPGKKFKPIKSKKFDETPPPKRQPQRKTELKQQQSQKKMEFQSKKSDIKPKAAAKPVEADIHPSWKAKAQMRKTQIQNFQGTKIKFDD